MRDPTSPLKPALVIRKASVYAHVVQESIMPVRDLGEGIENFDDWYNIVVEMQPAKCHV